MSEMWTLSLDGGAAERSDLFTETAARLGFGKIRELMEPPAKVTKRIGFEASAQAAKNRPRSAR